MGLIGQVGTFREFYMLSVCVWNSERVGLIRRRLLHMIDHKNCHEFLSRFQFQPKLLAKGSENVRPGRTRHNFMAGVDCSSSEWLLLKVILKS